MNELLELGIEKLTSCTSPKAAILGMADFLNAKDVDMEVKMKLVAFISMRYHESKVLSEQEWLKANEVMSILNITRQTLTSYKKRNLIRTYVPLGKGQYLYNKEDVLKLLVEGGKKH